MNATKARHMKPIAVAWRIADIGILISILENKEQEKLTGLVGVLLKNANLQKTRLTLQR